MGTPASLEIAQTAGLCVTALTEKEGKAVEEAIPGFFYGIWRKGTFGLDVDTPSMGMAMAFYARADLGEDLVYGATKAIYEHTDELAKVHPKGAEWTLANATKNPVIPFHPGAIKYYKEKGTWTPQLEAANQRMLKKLE